MPFSIRGLWGDSVVDKIDGVGENGFKREDDSLSKPVFSLEEIAIGTPLWQKLTDMNLGRKPQCFETVGTKEDIYEQLSQFLKNVMDNELVALSITRVDNIKNTKQHIILIDLARAVKMRVRKIVLTNTIVNKADIFLLDVTEMPEKDHLYLGHISLDVGEGEGLFKLRGHGFMEHVFRNMEKLLRTKFAGHTLGTDAHHKNVHRFMQHMGAVSPKVFGNHLSRLQAGEPIENLWAEYFCIIKPFGDVRDAELGLLAAA